MTESVSLGFKFVSFRLLHQWVLLSYAGDWSAGAGGVLFYTQLSGAPV